MSSPPPASPPMVWPPSNPSGTVIPFPLPWGQTGCCPPGGLDALMKCYCDIQQASAFIGQIMLDQINNNPAIIQAIIAALEKSGSNVPLLGVTNGSDAQPGQVGEWINMEQSLSYPVTAAFVQTVTMGVLNPGDWNCWVAAYCPNGLTGANLSLNPPPTGADGITQTFLIGASEQAVITTPAFRISASVPNLIALEVVTNQAGPSSAAGTMAIGFFARRSR